MSKEMDLKEAYRVMQKASGIEVGDKVKVLRTAKRGEMGWYGLCDNTRMQKLNLGQILKVANIADTGECYIELEFYNGGTTFIPFFTLEIIEKAKQEKMVTIDGKEYSESTIIRALKDYVG